jgi:Glycosyl transferases group 1
MVQTARASAHRSTWTARIGRTSRPLRVTVASTGLFGDRSVALLNRLGIDARQPELQTDGHGAHRSRLERIRSALSADVSLHLYGRRDLKRLELWLARLGLPTLTLWIGSDVVLHAPHASKAMTERSWHWSVAPWLQDELAEVGIDSKVVRATPPHVPDRVPALPDDFAVLAYILDDRGELYGLEFVLELARRRPDIRFLLLAARSSDELPENVTALGWVDDVRAVVSQTVVYLRPTSHDGLSNLVLEALAYGRYVLWTYPFPGVGSATTVDDAEARLSELHARHKEGKLPLNEEGRAAVLEMFEPAAVRSDIVQGLTAIANQGWRRPPGPIRRWFARSALKTLRVALRADQAWTTVEP